MSFLIQNFFYPGEIITEEGNRIDVVVEVNFLPFSKNKRLIYTSPQVCGASSVINDGIRLLKPGGLYLFLGMVHPQSELNITGEQIIRKCLTIKGNEKER